MSTDKGRAAKPSRSAPAGPRRAPVPSLIPSLPKTIGKYAVLARIGVGAMGVVYKCSQPGLNRPVAVKVLTSSKHALGDVLPRFQREARAASRLNHPSVVQVYDIGTEGELHYIVMEFVDGWSLDKLIGSPGLTVDYTLRLLVHVARALHAAHEAGIVHRDIKPSNILIHRTGLPKLADFGLAKSLHDGPTLSRSGDILGTPRYMSPEQVLLSPKDIDARTDVYSLGAVMYEMLTGKPPVDGPNVMVMLRMLTDEEPTPVRQRNANVPEAVAAICHKALAKERDDRYANAAQMAESLQNYLLEKLLGSAPPPTDAPPLPPPPREPGPWRRRVSAFAATWRRRLVLAGMVLAVALGTAVWAGLPARWAAAYNGKAPESAPPSGPGSGSAADSLIAQARTHLDRTLALHASALPRERFQALVDDLSAAVNRNPSVPEVRCLRGQAYRLGGEYLAAVDDLGSMLAKHPERAAARFDRLLANYQLRVLYLDNFNEAVLRLNAEPAVRQDVDALLADPLSYRQYAARLIDALARQSPSEAAQLAEAGLPPDVPAAVLPDLAMLQADALYHAASWALAEELAAPDDQRAARRQRREELAAKAEKALSAGLNADPNHVGLLFLLANSIPKRADWAAADGQDRERILRRLRSEFDVACDRLRGVTLRQGCDTPLARAVLWSNFGRRDLALDQVKDALSCRPTIRELAVVKGWLTLHHPADGILGPSEIGRALRELQAAFETPPDAFNAFFVRALLHAAVGHWDWDEAARADLLQCQRRLQPDKLPTDVAVYNQWFRRAAGSPTEYLDATQQVLDALPLTGETRIRLAEEVLRLFGDPEIVKRDRLDDSTLRAKRGLTHLRAARLYAEQKDRAKVVMHVRGALEQKLPFLKSQNFRDDAAFSPWGSNEEFQNLLRQFEEAPPPPQ